MPQTPWYPTAKPRRLTWTWTASVLCMVLAGCGGVGSLSKSDLSQYAISRGDDDEEEENEAPAVARTQAAQPPAIGANSSAAQSTADAAPPTLANSASTAASSTSRDPSLKPSSGTASKGSASEPSISGSASEPSISGSASEPSISGSASEPSISGSASEPSISGSAGEPSKIASNPNQTATEPASDSGSLKIAGIAPIADRRPAEPLPIVERRKRSIENLQKLNSAVVRWMNQGSRIPTSVIRDATRRPGLSWRVAILPLLGYQELYDQFNLKEPWDSPTNKALLDYIPEEFVSPDRFDSFTNYQLFVNGTALFSEREAKDPSEVSDGPSVLIMAEVDDPAAVPWTAPFDYDVTEQPLTRALGHLREDGAFVGWMTGRPALWPKPISEGILHKALTFEAGDNVNFGPYMGYPPDQAGGSNRPSLGNQASSLAGNSSSGESTSSSLPHSTLNPGLPPGQVNNRGTSMLVQAPLPPREAVIAAESKMRATYEDAFKSARTRLELARLAKTIHQQLLNSGAREGSISAIANSNGANDGSAPRIPGESSLPPAELFVGLRSAFRVAIRGGDANLALQLLRELHGRFQINLDQYQDEMLDGLLGKKGALRTDLNKATNLIPLLEDIVLRNIEEDNYRSAETNLEYGLAVVRNMNDRETNYRWKVLRERVEEGKRRFPRVAKFINVLEANPDDPDANLSVGWYLCIVKGNWEAGAKLLAKSDDRSLRALALLEIQQDANVNRDVTLGDGWWDYAQQNQDDELEFEAAMQRSRHWYQSASAYLPDGLDRIRANNRLNAIDRAIGRPEEAAGANFNAARL